MPLQSPPKTIVVVGPEHPQGLRWREAMRERGALLAHTERVPQALDWLSRLAPDWLISVTPLPAPPHCRQLTWSGTQEELESLLHDIAPPPSASETLVLGELEIDPQQEDRRFVHRVSDHRRRSPKSSRRSQEGRRQGHRRHLRHRRRLQEVLPRRDRHPNASRPILKKEMDDCKPRPASSTSNCRSPSTR
jgi:hypothetical protein